MLFQDLESLSPRFMEGRPQEVTEIILVFRRSLPQQLLDREHFSPTLLLGRAQSQSSLLLAAKTQRNAC